MLAFVVEVYRLFGGFYSVDMYINGIFLLPQKPQRQIAEYPYHFLVVC